MRPGSVLAFALVFAGGSGAALAADPPPRLGSITESDGGLLPGWLSGSKGSLLQVAPGEPATPDVAEAIRHYEALLAYARDPATRAEALRRAAYLRVRVGDGADGIDRDSLEAALALYDRLFAAYPDVAGNDRALYQQARALHLLGRTDDAAESLATLVARYPQSERHADAAFRAGELFYATDQPGRAASAYDAMLADGTASPDLRRLASYKLGWARLRNGEPDAAVAAFVPVIDEALAGDDDDRFHEAVLDDLPSEQRDIAGDALRGISLAFLRAGSVAQVDPSAAVAGRIDARAALYHSALAALMLERERYTDAATTFAAFAGSRSAHPLAAAFQDRAVRAYEAGGFVEPAMAARAELARRFHPDGPYWEGREADAAFGERFRTHVATLARHHHAMAQELADTDGAGAEHFLIAADWYRELIALLPADGERVAEARLHRADALLEGGDLPGAVAQYRALAFEQSACGRSRARRRPDPAAHRRGGTGRHACRGTRRCHRAGAAARRGPARAPRARACTAARRRERLRARRLGAGAHHRRARARRRGRGHPAADRRSAPGRGRPFRGRPVGRGRDRLSRRPRHAARRRRAS
ncbi:tetratricopeptide repeat protein [Algiphilus sp.]|uniref:tetratricopeptide repeat protein n=1 Tax=Algiphilus sp. TaxID=1872431 RepID=UPI003C442219